MKLRKIRVPVFSHVDDFGTFEAHDVEILFDPEENEITPESFDQKRHAYFLDDREVERLARESAQRFYDENASAIVGTHRKVKRREFNAIKTFLKISGADLGHLIGLDKSSISRILSGTGIQELQKDKAMLLLERLQDELEHPGKSKILLTHLKKSQPATKHCELLCLPALLVAEFFVRNIDEITNLKLQKLLYYAQGIGFGRAHVKLIKEPFLAWEHGPVIREVYDQYKKADSAPLKMNPEVNLDRIFENEQVVAILEETLSLYGPFDAWFLRQKTHREKPWRNTRRNEVIQDEHMIEYFRKLMV